MAYGKQPTHTHTRERHTRAHTVPRCTSRSPHDHNIWQYSAVTPTLCSARFNLSIGNACTRMESAHSSRRLPCNTTEKHTALRRPSSFRLVRERRHARSEANRFGLVTSNTYRASRWSRSEPCRNRTSHIAVYPCLRSVAPRRQSLDSPCSRSMPAGVS